MNKPTSFIIAALFSVSLVVFLWGCQTKPAAGSADEPLVTLGGEVGAADKASINRFRSVPYDELPWIRADLTGEKASEFDEAGWDHIQFRPFKNYSGDISGRFIEIMAINAHGDCNVHPAFKALLAELPKHQRPGGYFAASGLIDWQKPIDHKDIYESTMMPALWGNARLLCGLVEASRAFPDNAPLLATARRLGDFYVGLIPRFADPARMSEYTGGDTYAAGYVTCYFPAMEGLVKLHTLTGERKYLKAAVTMAAFYKQFDHLPIDHAHGMLCNQVSLVLLYEATRDVSYLERVEKRWDELVTGGYINPAGGILEKCQVKFARDEGCAIADWMRLNLALGRVTGKARYWEMAERALHNHFLQNQTPNGGFGHRNMLCDKNGVYGFGDSYEEAVWCCTFHGQLGFVNLRSHLLNRSEADLIFNFALDFTARYADGTAVSEILPVAAEGEVLRQRIRLDGLPATVLRVRQPHWANAVTAVAADGSALPLVTKDGFCVTARPVSEATFIYAGGIYAEDRHCRRLPAGPVASEAYVIGYGPKLLAAQGRVAAVPTWPTTIGALRAQGLEPFSAALRGKECCFVTGYLSLAVSARPVRSPSPIICSEFRNFFISPPDYAKPRVYWWWLFNRVDKEGITRDLEEFKSKGISGVNLICTGGYAGKEPLPGVKYQSPEWWGLFRHAVKEAKRNNIELGFNLSAGGWTMQGPWVTKDNAMKKVVSSELKIAGPTRFSGKLPQPETVEEYYHDIWVQAFRVQGGDTKIIDPKSIIELTDRMKPDGQLDWDVPDGKWVILRNGYTLTGHLWSRWFAWPGPPQADTFEGGDGYEIDYLKTSALDDHFEHLGRPILEEAKMAGGNLAYLWSDSWECGKLTWTQDFSNQFSRFRGYDLKPYMPVLAGYTVANEEVTARFRDDFDRTVQDCISQNFYGYFMELCHKNGLKVGNEAAGPNDIPPIDALKNLGYCDIPAGEFWVNGHRKAQNGYNSDRFLRLNLKQTATAAHIYGKREAMAEAFTMMDGDATHWALGPADLKPYANDAFCEGINRFMLHQATCQPPSDGKPGYEFCAGQHFTPNLTWWEQAPAFFSYLSRCQYMLQQGTFVADVCFYLGERPPTLAPPKYVVPSLGSGYDCDYSNSDVLINRMTAKDGRIVLPDGMSYRILVLQNCTSPSQEISEKVGSYQKLPVSWVPSTAMSLEVIKKIRELILAGATVVGPPPENTIGLKNFPESEEQLKKIASEIWGDLDGKIRTERRFGKGRVIWGKTAREILLADGVTPDFTFQGQEANPEQFDYIHRTYGDVDIYFVINRTNQPEKREFTFRVTGKQPEIWNAVTGETYVSHAYNQANASTSLSLDLDRFSSYFIVFRKSVPFDPVGSGKKNFPELKELTELSGPWKISFDPRWGGPDTVTFPELISWTDRPEEGIKYYSGKATYKKTFDLSLKADGDKKVVPETERLFLDFGEIKDVAEVRLNGKKLGILWCHPWRIEITDAVKPTGNQLEVDVINLWANRVIGDLNQPKEKRFTKTHDEFRFDFLTGKTQLIKSGLIGPVKVYLAD